MLYKEFEHSRAYPLEQRLINKLPRKHARAYINALENPVDRAEGTPQLWEMYCRCRLIQDYIGGMTDQFAYDEYKKLAVSD